MNLSQIKIHIFRF